MNKQTGFTLIELAIVLVIIGLLLGGVLRGQELINSARVKNLTRDFQNIQVFTYGYQDRFHALPGDDAAAITHAGAAANGDGDGLIEGAWDSNNNADESKLYWQAVRLAGFAPGPTDLDAAEFPARNTNGGRLGIQSIGGAAPFSKITGMNGSFAICSDAILGRDAIQIDIALDDGNTATGSLRAILGTDNGAADDVATVTAAANSPHTVCMAI